MFKQDIQVISMLKGVIKDVYETLTYLHFPVVFSNLQQNCNRKSKPK